MDMTHIRPPTTYFSPSGLSRQEAGDLAFTMLYRSREGYRIFTRSEVLQNCLSVVGGGRRGQFYLAPAAETTTLFDSARSPRPGYAAFMTRAT